MAHIYDLTDEQVNKLYQEWSITNDDKSFESEKHLKNSFILFVKNNASSFKKARGYPIRDQKKSENVFAKLLEEEIQKENQNRI
jgi:hypothetical protein